MRNNQVDTQTEEMAKVGYETRDMALGALMKWLGAVIVFAILSASVTLGIYKLFTLPQKEQTASALPFVRRIPQDPQPLLQADPVQDMRKFRDDEDKDVHGYGWIDKDKGVVKLPVERALELMAERAGSGQTSQNTTGQETGSPTPAR